MKKAEQYNVQTDINLVFKSKGHNYAMKLLIEEGLIILEGNRKTQVIFLGDNEDYYGEHIIAEKPKRKRRKKNKPCSNEEEVV